MSFQDVMRNEGGTERLFEESEVLQGAFDQVRIFEIIKDLGGIDVLGIDSERFEQDIKDIFVLTFVTSFARFLPEGADLDDFTGDDIFNNEDIEVLEEEIANMDTGAATMLATIATGGIIDRVEQLIELKRARTQFEDLEKGELSSESKGELQKFMEGYILEHFPTLDKSDPEYERYEKAMEAMKVLAYYMVEVLDEYSNETVLDEYDRQVPKSKLVVEALLRMFDASHSTVMCLGINLGSQFEPDALRVTEGNLGVSDPYLLTDFVVDVLDKIEGEFKKYPDDPQKNAESYQEFAYMLRSIDDGLKIIHYGTGKENIATRFAEFMDLSVANMGPRDVMSYQEAIVQINIQMDGALSRPPNNATVPHTGTAAGLRQLFADRTPGINTLMEMSGRNREVGTFFETMFSMSPQKAKDRFIEIGSIPLKDTKGGIGNTLLGKTTMEYFDLIGLTPDKIYELVDKYEEVKENTPLTADTLAFSLWNNETGVIKGRAKDWVRERVIPKMEEDGIPLMDMLELESETITLLMLAQDSLFSGFGFPMGPLAMVLEGHTLYADFNELIQASRTVDKSIPLAPYVGEAAYYAKGFSDLFINHVIQLMWLIRGGTIGIGADPGKFGKWNRALALKFIIFDAVLDVEFDPSTGKYSTYMSRPGETFMDETEDWVEMVTGILLFIFGREDSRNWLRDKGGKVRVSVVEKIGGRRAEKKKVSDASDKGLGKKRVRRKSKKRRLRRGANRVIDSVDRGYERLAMWRRRRAEKGAEERAQRTRGRVLEAFERKRRQKSERLRSLEEQRVAHDSRMTVLGLDIERLRTEHTSLTDNQGNLTERLQQAREELATTKSDLTNTRSRLEAARAEERVAKTKGEVPEDILRNKSDLEAEEARLKGEIDRLEELTKGLQEELDNVNRDLSGKDDDLKSAEKEARKVGKKKKKVDGKIEKEVSPPKPKDIGPGPYEDTPGMRINLLDKEPPSKGFRGFIERNGARIGGIWDFARGFRFNGSNEEKIVWEGQEYDAQKINDRIRFVNIDTNKDGSGRIVIVEDIGIYSDKGEHVLIREVKKNPRGRGRSWIVVDHHIFIDSAGEIIVEEELDGYKPKKEVIVENNPFDEAKRYRDGLDYDRKQVYKKAKEEADGKGKPFSMEDPAPLKNSGIEIVNRKRTLVFESETDTGFSRGKAVRFTMTEEKGAVSTVTTIEVEIPKSGEITVHLRRNGKAVKSIVIDEISEPLRRIEAKFKDVKWEEGQKRIDGTLDWLLEDSSEKAGRRLQQSDTGKLFDTFKTIVEAIEVDGSLVRSEPTPPVEEVSESKPGLRSTDDFFAEGIKGVQDISRYSHIMKAICESMDEALERIASKAQILGIDIDKYTQINSDIYTDMEIILKSLEEDGFDMSAVDSKSILEDLKVRYEDLRSLKDVMADIHTLLESMPDGFTINANSLIDVETLDGKIGSSARVIQFTTAEGTTKAMIRFGEIGDGSRPIVIDGWNVSEALNKNGYRVKTSGGGGRSGGDHGPVRRQERPPDGHLSDTLRFLHEDEGGFIDIGAFERKIYEILDRLSLERRNYPKLAEFFDELQDPEWRKTFWEKCDLTNKKWGRGFDAVSAKLGVLLLAAFGIILATDRLKAASHADDTTIAHGEMAPGYIPALTVGVGAEAALLYRQGIAQEMVYMNLLRTSPTYARIISGSKLGLQLAKIGPGLIGKAFAFGMGFVAGVAVSLYLDKKIGVPMAEKYDTLAYDLGVSLDTINAAQLWTLLGRSLETGEKTDFFSILDESIVGIEGKRSEGGFPLKFETTYLTPTTREDAVEEYNARLDRAIVHLNDEIEEGLRIWGGREPEPGEALPQSYYDTSAEEMYAPTIVALTYEEIQEKRGQIKTLEDMKFSGTEEVGERFFPQLVEEEDALQEVSGEAKATLRVIHNASRVDYLIQKYASLLPEEVRFQERITELSFELESFIRLGGEASESDKERINMIRDEVFDLRVQAMEILLPYIDDHMFYHGYLPSENMDRIGELQAKGTGLLTESEKRELEELRHLLHLERERVAHDNELDRLHIYVGRDVVHDASAVFFERPVEQRFFSNIEGARHSISSSPGYAAVEAAIDHAQTPYQRARMAQVFEDFVEKHNTLSGKIDTLRRYGFLDEDWREQGKPKERKREEEIYDEMSDLVAELDGIETEEELATWLTQ